MFGKLKFKKYQKSVVCVLAGFFIVLLGVFGNLQTARADDPITPSDISFTATLAPTNFFRIAKTDTVKFSITLKLNTPAAINSGDEIQLNNGSSSISQTSDPIDGYNVGFLSQADSQGSTYCVDSSSLFGIKYNGSITRAVNGSIYSCNYPVSSDTIDKDLKAGDTITFNFSFSPDDRAKLGIQQGVASDQGAVGVINAYPFIEIGSFSFDFFSNGSKFSVKNISFKDAALPLTFQIFNTPEQVAQHQADPPPQGVGPNVPVSFSPGQSVTLGTGLNPLDPLGVLLSGIITFLVALIQNAISGIFSLVIAPVIQAMLSIHVYTDAFVQIIYPGWQVVRNLCDMLFILALIIIAMATLLRVESYQYKSLLVQLILAALFINFSLVIAQAVLGVADTVQAQFLPANAQVIKNLAGNLIFGSRSLVLSNASTIFQGSLASIIQQFFWLSLSLGSFMVFGAIAVFLAIRIVVLWILLMVSPAAYAAGVLPNTAHFREEWWTMFLKYAFFTPIMAFFLNMAALMSNTFKDSQIFNTLNPSLSASLGGSDLAKFVFLVLSNVVLIVFLFASLMIAEQFSIYGAKEVTGFAKKYGVMAPFGVAAFGAKAGRDYALEKFKERTGIELRPSEWKKGWEESRKLNKAKREERGLATAYSKGSALASPITFFQRYWGFDKAGRVLQGGTKMGRAKVAQAERLREQAKNEDNADRKEELLKRAIDLEKEGKHLIAPDDTFTQAKLRHAIHTKHGEINTENWHELVSLGEAAIHEDDAMEFVAILNKLAETYNENEIANKFQYTRNMVGNDGQLHKKGDNFAMSPEGLKDFGELILGEQLRLGKEPAIRFIGDMSDICEKKGHNVLMRISTVENGKARWKTKAEMDAEYIAEMEKTSWQKTLNSNRLVGFMEVPDADYDVTGNRKTVVTDKFLTLFLRNFHQNTEYGLQRNWFSTSMLKAFAENKEAFEKAAELIPEHETLEDPQQKKFNEATTVEGVTYAKGDTVVYNKRQYYKDLVEKIVEKGQAAKGAENLTLDQVVENTHNLMTKEHPEIYKQAPTEEERTRAGRGEESTGGH